MPHTVFVEGAWGQSVVQCHPGEVLLDALVRHGVPVAFCCKAGLCGMCKAELKSGKVNRLPYSARALSDDDVSRGRILTCCSSAATDCAIRPLNVLDNSDGGGKASLATIEANSRAPSDLTGGRLLRLCFDAPDVIAKYRPGNWAQLHSLTGSLNYHLGCFVESDSADIATGFFAMSPQQVGNPSEFEPCIGDRLYVDGPHGMGFDNSIFERPVAMIVDDFGLPVVNALSRVGTSPSKSLIQLLIVVSERTCDSGTRDIPPMPLITKRFQRWPTLKSAEGSIREALGVLMEESVGRRPKLLVRGAPNFQNVIRKIASDTGIRPWDVSAEALLDLTQTSENARAPK